MDTSWLPGIDYWGAQRIDDTINKDAAGGALAGMLLATPISRLAAIAASIGRQHAGPLGGHVAWYASWPLTAYVALLVIAHWKSLDNST